MFTIISFFYSYLFLSLGLSFFSLYVDLDAENQSLNSVYHFVQVVLPFIGLVAATRLKYLPHANVKCYKYFIYMGLINLCLILCSLLVFYFDYTYGELNSNLTLLNNFFWDMEGYLLICLPLGIYFALKQGVDVRYLNSYFYIAIIIPIMEVIIGYILKLDAFIGTLVLTYLYLVEINLLFVLMKFTLPQRKKKIVITVFIFGATPTIMFIIMGMFYVGTFLHIFLTAGSVAYLFWRPDASQIPTRI